MKKLLILTSGLIFCMGVFAQETKAPLKKNNYLSLSAGPAFPMGDFASKDITTNEQAGMAQSGLSVNLQYAHTWGTLGIVAQGFYNSHSVQSTTIDGIQIDMDHWQYYGLMVGPAFIKPVSANGRMILDAKALVGAVNANSPQFSIGGQPLINEKWNTTVGYGVGMGMKLLFGKSMFAQLGLDYLAMSPEFTIEGDAIEDPTGTEYTQPISTLNLHFGIGINF
jgi:opacity protein-like surface antigen